MDIELMNQEVAIILQRYEAIAAKRAILENDELSGYEDEIDEDFVECYTEFVALVASVIPRLRSGEFQYENLHVALRVNSISEFADYMSSQDASYPMLNGYVETLQDWLWAPLHESLRKVFTLEVVKSISAESEFDLAWRGYCESLDLYSVYAYDNNEIYSAINVIIQLQSLGIANSSQTQQMSIILDKLQGMMEEDYVPPRISEFAESSVGLEGVISAWINEVTTTPQLIFADDTLDLNHEHIDPIIEDLKQEWFKVDAAISAVDGNRFWQLIDSNIETGFRTERKFLGKKKNKIYIHTLYQLQEIVIGQSGEGFNRPLDKWKICLLRTGFRHEYLPNEGNGLIAAQLLTASKVLESSLDNFSAEVNWLRLGQRESVLEGISRVEAEALADAFFENF
jgi:hypothetical protein